MAGRPAKEGRDRREVTTGDEYRSWGLEAMGLEWISSEQKGFLPGINGIQEHTEVLTAAIVRAKKNKEDLSICFLDLANAFGSLPQAVLCVLFDSLPVPDALKRILKDIYKSNRAEFVVNGETISIYLTAGIRQGDGLSSIVFTLAGEPLVRALKKLLTVGFELFGIALKVTAFVDDLAVISGNRLILQAALVGLVAVARILGLEFNAGKCATLTHTRGKVQPSQALTINGAEIREVGDEEAEQYLGTPIVSKFTFTVPTDLPAKLALVASSLLSPWEKLEVFRAHLMPSLSHHLASGRVEKASLEDLDKTCRNFLASVACVPDNTHRCFYYADRRVGGLGAPCLKDEADVWTLSRAVQLLFSRDPVVRAISWGQLSANVSCALRLPAPTNFSGAIPPVQKSYGAMAELPLAEYLSGNVDKGLYNSQGLYSVRYSSQGLNLWGRARKAAGVLNRKAWSLARLPPLKVEIDVSSENRLNIADDVSLPSSGSTSVQESGQGLSVRLVVAIPDLSSAANHQQQQQQDNDADGGSSDGDEEEEAAAVLVVATRRKRAAEAVEEVRAHHELYSSIKPCKAVRGLRSAVRAWHTLNFIKAPMQGAAARCLLAHNSSDIASLCSTRTGLSFADWRHIFKARLCLLPVRGLPGSTAEDQRCRKGCHRKETTAHVLNNCNAARGLYIERHDAVLNVLVAAIRRAGEEPAVNRVEPVSQLKPDILIRKGEGGTPIIIDVTIPNDTVQRFDAAYEEKVAKYRQLGNVYPFLVGSLGSWMPANDEIRRAFNITTREWSCVRRRCRLLAIQGSTAIIEAWTDNNYQYRAEVDDDR